MRTKARNFSQNFISILIIYIERGYILLYVSHLCFRGEMSEPSPSPLLRAWSGNFSAGVPPTVLQHPVLPSGCHGGRGGNGRLEGGRWARGFNDCKNTCFSGEVKKNFAGFKNVRIFAPSKVKYQRDNQEWLPVASEGLFSCPAGAQHSGCITPWTGRNSLSEAPLIDF